MEKFAEKYYTDNPDVFQTADCAYVLAFSLIMLNTDQHSPNIKNRMTKEDFFRNNRGIDGGQDVPTAKLETLFDNIVREPFALGEDDAKRIQQEAAGAAAGRKFE